MGGPACSSGMNDALQDRAAPHRPAERSGRRLKILTYNVHSCVGTDGRLDPARIAAVIAQLQPDIIGLQELDVGRSRTGGIDQAETIASILQMQFHFNAALHLAEERYGDAILTALPVEMIKAGHLPSIGEQRGALWVEIDLDGRRLQVFNTHLGLRGRDRMAQIATLLGPDWLGHSQAKEQPKILIGDFNATPVTATYRRVTGSGLFDSRMVVAPAGGRPKPTFPARFPLLRLDHVFVSPEIRVVGARVDASPLARQASDHLPLMVTVDV